MTVAALINAALVFAVFVVAVIVIVQIIRMLKKGRTVSGPSQPIIGRGVRRELLVIEELLREKEEAQEREDAIKLVEEVIATRKQKNGLSA